MFARHRITKIVLPILVSRTITRQVLEQGLALLGTDVRAVAWRSGESGKVQCSVILCVPLAMFEKTTGCIYLDTTNAGARFDEDHLQLVAAIAGISAVALENASRLQWLEQENLRLATEINLEHNMVGESARMKRFTNFWRELHPTNPPS